MTLRGCDKAIAFDDSEKGRIDPRYAKSAQIHTVPHVPWKDRPQWKYTQKEKEEMVAFIKETIRTFVAEPCESAYSNKWFFLRKGGSNKQRWIQNLQRTNAVTIRDVGSIYEADLLVEGSAGRSIYSICDLFSRYDEIPLDYRDRHMTAMHTPQGLVQMMVVPMGWTNGVAVFQRAIIAVLKEFIPDKVEVFLDDFPIKGLVERDETEVFTGARKFVVDHMSDVRDVLVKLDDANLTVSGTERIQREALGYCLRGGHLFKRPTKFAIPMRVLCDPEERRAVIEELHDGVIGGHRGVKGTFDKVRRLYWWDGKYTEVEKYSSTCEACQKRATLRYKEPLVPSLPTAPGEKVHVDLVTMPKGIGGLRYIINSRDDLAGFVEAKAVKKKTAEEVSGFLLKYIARYGCVGRIVMDRGGEFLSRKVKALLEKAGIGATYTTAYHPQSNAPVERGHQTLVDALAK
ncbi:hypothetical protein CBR_g27983 [Chara braunii]|uniref:Integrase catalytic domain-containing protein n=1 Tax=Chara braunii TaxID=69332 RepID=A0A388L8W6_CHABU|nr:hypothetical protein CBR_g27983 [Chara braunii]|eukprot:GBG78759.1 hypothetical protein CBR_g27983 [Chara braunii]